jgi:hypothetical protein
VKGRGFAWFADAKTAEAEWPESMLSCAQAGPDSTWFNHVLRPVPPGDNTWGRRGYAHTWLTHEFAWAGGR